MQDVTHEIAREIRSSSSMLSRQVGGTSGYYKKLTPAQARVLAKYSGVRLPHVSSPLIYGFRPSLPKTEHKTLLMLVLGGQMRVMRESGHLPGTHPESVVGAHSFAHYRLLADPSFLSPERHESGGNPRTSRSKKPKPKFASGEFVKNVRVTKTPDFAPVAAGSLAKIIRQDKESGRYFVLWTWNQKTGWYEEDLFEPADIGGGAGARHERGGNPHTASKHHPSLMGFRSPPREIAHGFKMRVVLGAKDAGLSAGKMTHRSVLVSWRKSSLYSIPIHAGADTIGFAQLYIHEDGSSYEQLTTANRAETYSTLDFGWLSSKASQFRGLGRAGGAGKAASVKDEALKAKVKKLVGGKK